MKQHNIIQRLSFFLVALWLAAPTWAQDVSTYEIASMDDWKSFCDLVNGGQTNINAKLMKDIELSTDSCMVGTYDDPYSGTFDGQGHTLTLNWNFDLISDIAPFRCVKDVTIKNLHIKGRITSNYRWVSGLVANVDAGTNLISNCISEVNITSSHEAAGLVQFTAPNTHTTITDCIVMGKMNATSENGQTSMAGFVFDQHGTCTLNNCLYIGSNNAISDYGNSVNFAQDATLENCYYLNPCGNEELQGGTKITELQLKNGEVAKLLQAGRTGQCYWAQTLGEMPSLFDANLTNAANYVYYDTAEARWTCSNMQIADGTALPVGIDITAKKVTNSRIITANATHSLCLSYSLPLPAGMTAYQLSEIKGTTARFEAIETTVLSANQPYLVVCKTATSLNVDGTTNIAAQPEAGSMSSVDGYALRGSIAGMTNAEAEIANAYILQNDGLWHKVTADNESGVVLPYRAYITLPTNAPAKTFSIAFNDGTTTGLRAIETVNSNGTARYYDLNGRYIGTTLDGQPRGIYIKNGKKVINQ